MGKQLVPQLRFPEFKGEWESDSVNNRAEKLKVGFVGTCEPFYTNKENGILLVRTGNLKGVDIILDDVKYVTSDFHKKNIKSQLYPDDLILARHGGKGEICLVPKNFPTANCLNIVILRIDNTIDSKYFQLIYGTTSIQKQITAVTAGSTQTVINTKEIGLLKFKFPSLQEQNKIASFFKVIDAKITKLTKKKDLLEQYKKGIMQKIFSQELRFKDENGNDFPKWGHKKLGEISERVGVGLATSVTEYYTAKSNESIPIIRNLNIKKGYFDDSDMLYLEPSFSDLHKNKRVRKGDLITVHTGSNVGLSCVVPEKYHLAQTFTTLIVTPKNKIIDSNFLNQFLASNYGSYQALRLVVGGGKGNLNTKDFKLYPVPLPVIEEQTKIANFLSDIDVKIEALNTKIENSKAFKKGLLQQMFV